MTLGALLHGGCTFNKRGQGTRRTRSRSPNDWDTPLEKGEKIIREGKELCKDHQGMTKKARKAGWRDRRGGNTRSG